MRCLVAAVSAFLFAVSGSVVVPAFGQGFQTASIQVNPPKQSSAAVPTLRANAQLVIVDVVVLDKNKQPVHGLKAEDFTLLENGTVQTFKGFEEHTALTAEQLAKEQALTPAVKLQPGTFSNFAAARFDGPMNVLLLDKLNTSKADQKQMQKQINDYLDHARPGQRIAVFALTDQLTMVQGFTDDVEALRKAVNSVKGLTDSPLLSTPAAMQMDAGVLTGDDADTARGPTQAMDSGMNAILNVRAQATEHVELRVTYTLAAMSGLARYLGTLPGRKNLVWFSGSFPVNIMPKNPYQGISTGGPPTDTPFTDVRVREKDFQIATSQLSRSQTAVYPIDVKGLRQASVFSAEDNGCGGCPMVSGREVTRDIMNGIGDFAEHNFGENSTMYSLADDTGGKAFLNTNNFNEAMNKALDDGANYYTIAYTPSNTKWNGSLRRIQVRLRQKGYELSYRHGYFADEKDARDEVAGTGDSRGMQVALTHGAPEPTQLLFSTRVQPVSAVTENDAAPRNKPAKGVTGPFRRYRVDYAIDPREIRFALGVDGKRHETLEFVIYVYDANGKLVDSVGQSIETMVTPTEYAQFQQSGVPYHQEVSVPAKGEYSLRIAMRDAGADHVGAIEVPVASVRDIPPMEAAISK